MGKNRTTMRSDIRAQLKDPSTLWSDAELNSCIERAVADLSRFHPYEQVYEAELEFTVTNETWTAAAAAGTYVSLTYKPIKWDSETVTDSSGNACTRGTDYYIDYTNGKITHISGGEIDNDEADCVISYTKSKIAIDISSLTTLIKVEDVLYPVGDVPQSFPSYRVWNSMLWLEGDVSSQYRMTEDKHIAVRYLAEHTAPTDSAAGTFPSVQDWNVILCACAYACLIKAADYEHEAITDIDTVTTYTGDANSVLDLITSGGVAQDAITDITTALDAAIVQLAAAATALGKVDTSPDANLTEAEASFDSARNRLQGDLIAAEVKAEGILGTNVASAKEDSAMYIINKITDDAASLKSAVTTALDAANSYLDEVDTTDLQGAEGVWTDEEKFLEQLSYEGSATSTSARQLVDSAQTFPEDVAGMIVYNRTDDTWAWVVDYVNGTTLELSHDIMASGEDYVVLWPMSTTFISLATKFVNSITTGRNVPERMAQLAQVSMAHAQMWAQKRGDFIGLAGARTSAAMGYVREAETRLDTLRTYIDQANALAGVAVAYLNEASGINEAARTHHNEAMGRIEIARTWVTEASERTESALGYIQEAQYRIGICRVYSEEAAQRIAIANAVMQKVYMDLQIAQQWRAEGVERRNEVWAIWADPKQFSSAHHATASVYQIPGGGYSDAAGVLSGVRVG